MSRPGSRLARSRTTPLVAILLLTVVLAAFLAYEAWDAARSHRAAAERAVRDYANFAAWEFTVHTKEHLHSTFAFVFSPVAKLDRHLAAGGALPGPEILKSDKTASLECAVDSARTYFR